MSVSEAISASSRGGTHASDLAHRQAMEQLDGTAERQQRTAAAYLASASAALSASLDYGSTLANLANLLVPDLADWCAVHLLENRKLETVAVAHIKPEKVTMAADMQRKYPPDLTRPYGVANVLRTGVSELYPEVSEAMLAASARNEEHLRALLDVGMRSIMIVPLRSAGRPIGTMSLSIAESARRFSAADLELAEELGRRAGVAVEHARLYREAQLATERAEKAVQVRDEFLSIAGHELKTPLAALSLQLQGLESALRSGTLAANPERFAERLQKTLRYADRLERLMSALLDVSRISSGRLALEMEQVELEALVHDVVNRHSEELGRAQSSVQIVCDGEVIGHWDRERMDQVVSNLLSNAIKYGPQHPIEIRIESDEKSVSLCVRDRGIGVSSEDRERIFKRFERAVSKRNYGGFGVGLWIVQSIVEAHRGTIELSSAPGEGAAFTVKLPKHPEAK